MPTFLVYQAQRVTRDHVHTYAVEAKTAELAVEYVQGGAGEHVDTEKIELAREGESGWSAVKATATVPELDAAYAEARGWLDLTLAMADMRTAIAEAGE